MPVITNNAQALVRQRTIAQLPNQRQLTMCGRLAPERVLLPASEVGQHHRNLHNNQEVFLATRTTVDGEEALPKLAVLFGKLAYLVIFYL